MPFELPKDITQPIQQIYISQLHKTPDIPYWGLTQTGTFTSRSMYHNLVDKFTTSPTPPSNFSWIWKLPILPKIKAFLWLLYHDRLPTKAYLTNIHLIQNNTCTYCQNVEENIRHIFLLCENATAYWKELGLKNLLIYICTIQGTKN